MKEFTVGQKVKVTGNRACFSTMKDFFRINNLEGFINNYRDNDAILPGNYEVVGVGKHQDQNAYPFDLYLLRGESGQVFITSDHYKEMKPITAATLSTAEMIAALAANPEQRYKSVGAELYELEAYLNKKGYVLFKSPSERDQAFDGNIRPIDQWTLIPPKPHPVQFMEAVKAYSEGKVAECELVGNETRYYNPSNSIFRSLGGVYRQGMRDQFNDPVSAKEILCGKWFIKED